VNLNDLAQSIWALFNIGVVQPLARFFLGMNQGNRTVLYVLLATAVVLGFIVGRRRTLLQPGAIRSVVVFTGEAEFKTETPEGVIAISRLVEYLRDHTEEVMSLNRLQFCVGRLETARLAISGETDVEHIQSLERRRGSAR
jgi:hypothetical protein